jgi:hypothetical protein
MKRKILTPAPVYYQPGKPQPGTLTTHKPFKDMTPEEAHIWIAGIRARLQAKMQRERAYLDRRAKRGTHTPTDEAYAQDQILEAELLSMLDELERSI